MSSADAHKPLVKTSTTFGTFHLAVPSPTFHVGIELTANQCQSVSPPVPRHTLVVCRLFVQQEVAADHL